MEAGDGTSKDGGPRVYRIANENGPKASTLVWLYQIDGKQGEGSYPTCVAAFQAALPLLTVR
jgi:hypothetical protein